MLFLLAVSALSACASANLMSSVSKSGGGLELLVLHNNDMHARFEQTSKLSGVCSPLDRDAGKCYGGFSRVAHLVKEARAASQAGTGPQVLYLNAGDTYTGTAWFTLFKWEIAAECLNALQPDAVSLGNHEFDEDVSGLSPFLANLTSPVVAANLELSKVPELAIEANLHKSVVFNISGVKVGVIGYLTPDTKILAPRNDVEYIDEVVALKGEVSLLKAKGVEILIALGHSGWITDLRIAREVEGIDLVIGGHTNTFLWNGTAPDAEKIQGPYPTVVRQVSGRMVPAVQAYAYTKYLGKLHLVFDDQGELVSYDGNPILLDNGVPQDPNVLKIIQRYRDDVKRISDEVVGSTKVFLDGDTCRLHECNMGNLIADAYIDYYALNYKGDAWTDAPIAIIAGGDVRASIDTPTKPRNVTRGDLLTVMPFGNKIVTVTMNGTILMQVLEHSVSAYNPMNAPGQFLQFSGIQVTYDLAKPSGRRVVSAVARCSDCSLPQFHAIHLHHEYKVLMSHFVAQGGDGFTMLRDLPLHMLGWGDMMSVVDYFRRHSPMYLKVTSRVVLLNEEHLVVPKPEENKGGGGATATASSVTLALLLAVTWSLCRGPSIIN